MYKAISSLSGRCAALTRGSCSRPCLAYFHRASGALCQKSAFKPPSTDVPEMPPCNFSPEKYTGMSKDRMIEIRRQNCNPMTMKVTYYKKPVFIHQGYMQWLWDVDGRRYLDLFAGVATVSVGHCHPKVTAAAEQQLKKLWHTTNIYVYPTLHEYCEKLASHFPDPLKVIYLTNSGSESNDLAILMARLHTGNNDIITLRGSYHGGSPQTIGLTSNAAYKYPVASGFDSTNTMCPDVFRGPWGGSHCRDSPVQTIRECTCAQGHCMANEQYIAQLKETFATSVPNRIAAFFGEPIQGVGGAVQYPKNYLKDAYKLVRERGGICVADEVQTGFGRTGSHFWGFQGHDVIPDMVTMAKGIGNGFPMGAVVTTPVIQPVFQLSSQSAISCSVHSSVVYNESPVLTYLQLFGVDQKVQTWISVSRLPSSSHLQYSVHASRDPLPPEAMAEIFEDVKDMGVLIGKGAIYGQTFRIKPPMCITKEDVDFFMAVFDKSVRNYMEKR
uniref:Alanine--glyoxylate aminotransferase 2, mitochondrial n=1 Tax=Pundamilia nyererei TaxID=303518 RepID=A0A3B4FJQ0_9CICH